MQSYDVKATLKNELHSYRKLRIKNKNNYIDNINVLDFDNLKSKLKIFMPN